MPYIKYELRNMVDGDINRLSDIMYHRGAGIVAYVITKLILKYLDTTPNYESFALATGILETVKMELYRRLIAEYEIKKIYTNGDVFDESILS